ncbi:MAG: signal peptidase I [Deltaproteobacteria bacterium]|nr:signal peptidase I [Deltaproteobacteria bacterium]
MNQSIKQNKPRKPWLALVLGMIMPGLGHVYTGQLMKGVPFFLMFSFLIPASILLGLYAPDSALSAIVFLGVLMALAVYIFSIVDAFKSARMLSYTYAVQSYNKAYVYVALFFFGYFFVLSAFTSYCKDQLLEAYKVPTKSMIPALLPGDHFFVDKRINCPGCKYKVQRGDLAIFVYPNNRNSVYIKRIIGLPGDTIEGRRDEIFVNGKSIRGEKVTSLDAPDMNKLLEDYIAYLERGNSASYVVLWKKDMKQESFSVVVPDGQVFVLGDNRNDAHDSRHFGTVPLRDVTAKAKQIWFSRSSETGIRWRRFGKLLSGN